MSNTMSPAEAIHMIPGWDASQLTISRFSGGLSNRNYLVSSNGVSYFLRLDSLHHGVFELDRKIELAVLRNAGEAGLAPEVVFADPAAGVLLCRALPGQALDRANLNDQNRLADICRLLREVHDLPHAGVSFEPLEAAEMYVTGLESHHGLHAFALRCEQVISETGGPVDVRCCHNDTVAGNFVATPDLMLIDWEYACDNDPLFDLASLIGYHDLSHEQARFMLNQYDGNDDRWEQLQAQCRLYDAIQWLWLANRQVNNYNAANARRLEDLQQRIG